MTLPRRLDDAPSHNKRSIPLCRPPRRASAGRATTETMETRDFGTRARPIKCYRRGARQRSRRGGGRRSCFSVFASESRVQPYIYRVRLRGRSELREHRFLKLSTLATRDLYSVVKTIRTTVETSCLMTDHSIRCGMYTNIPDKHEQFISIVCALL